LRQASNEIPWLDITETDNGIKHQHHVLSRLANADISGKKEGSSIPDLFGNQGLDILKISKELQPW
jgi:hypothetical protein